MPTFDNSARVFVPETQVGDPTIEISVWQYAGTSAGGAKYGYVVTEGGLARFAGSDLHGPAHGVWPEADRMAITLAGFLGSTYEHGQLTEHGQQYSADEQAWLEVHAERLSFWASEVEEQRQSA